MSVTRRHGLYAVVADTTLIGAITRQTVNTGTEVQSEPTSDEVYPRFQSVRAQKPGASFTTLAIAAALDALGGLAGKSIADLTAGLTLYAQKHAEGGTRTAGSTHRKYNVTEGLILPETLSVAHQADATLGYNVIITYDGTNEPIVVTDSVPLPSGIADDERFTLGPITLENVSISQVRSFDLAFTIVAPSEGADSDIWDRFVSIETIQPVITIRGIDVEWLKAANIPLGGKAATHANTSIYLRKRAAGGTFVPDGTAEHIKFTADGLVYIDDAFNADNRAAAEATLTMPLRYDGANDPLVIDTAAVIT